MVYQNNKDLVYKLQKSGCYFLALLWVCQIENKKVMTVGEINKAYSYCLMKGWIDRDATIKKPDDIMNHYLEDKKMYQIGVLQDGEYTYWSWVKDESFDYSMVCYKTTGEYGTHWVTGDKEFKEYYDPLLGKGYNKVGVEKCVLYKLF